MESDDFSLFRDVMQRVGVTELPRLNRVVVKVVTRRDEAIRKPITIIDVINVCNWCWCNSDRSRRYFLWHVTTKDKLLIRQVFWRTLQQSKHPNETQPVVVRFFRDYL